MCPTARIVLDTWARLMSQEEDSADIIRIEFLMDLCHATFRDASWEAAAIDRSLPEKVLGPPDEDGAIPVEGGRVHFETEMIAMTVAGFATQIMRNAVIDRESAVKELEAAALSKNSVLINVLFGQRGRPSNLAMLLLANDLLRYWCLEILSSARKEKTV